MLQKTYYCFLTIVFLIIWPKFHSYGQSQEKIYSVMIVNLARGMEWPEKTGGNFIIGVLNYAPLTAELQTTSLASKVGTRKIEIREYGSPEEITGCHMVFVPAFKARSIEQILEKLKNERTVVVSNKTDLAKKGAGLNFVYIDGKLKYEINCNAIEKKGIKISSNVRNLGIQVK